MVWSRVTGDFSAISIKGFRSWCLIQCAVISVIWWVDIPFGQILFIVDSIHCFNLSFWLNFVASGCTVKQQRMFLSQPAHYPYVEKPLESKTTWPLCIYADLCAGFSSECHWTVIWKMALILNHAQWQRDVALNQSECVRYILLLMCLGTVQSIIYGFWTTGMRKWKRRLLMGAHAEFQRDSKEL